MELVSLPYYQQTFARLMEKHEDEFNYGLTEKFAEFRRELILNKFQPGKIIKQSDAWDFAKRALDDLDVEMSKIIRRRSAAYWMHIYRRIGVFLSPNHESNTDPVTLGLVRQFAELAIQKHGSLVSVKEFGFSNQLSPNLILGGWMKKCLKDSGRKAGRSDQLFTRYVRLLKSNPTWVLREFGKKDLAGIYEIEGAAYQYWRFTALLRTVGKGAEIYFDEGGEWHYVSNPDLRHLTVSIDKRNENTSSFSSLLGVWSDSDTLFKGRDGSENAIVFFPTYNINRIDLGGEYRPLNIRLPPNSITNFFPQYMHVESFLDHHDFMREEFKKKHGFDFGIFLQTLAGLSSFSIIPNKAMFSDDEDEREKIKTSAFIQTLTRGYHLFVGSQGDLVRTLADRMKLLFGTEFSVDAVQKVVSSISLTESRQSTISLWSGGPQSIVIPAGGAQLVNLVSILPLLSNLFVFMNDRYGTSGTVFEELFRSALERRGHNVEKGELTACCGAKRELDAGVIVDGKLFVFECVSIERPLDYEIGRPKTMKTRKNRLEKKLTQAKTLQKFVEDHPSGKNYDFSEVSEIEHIVVSPFVEWIWSLDENLWLEDGLPRILSPEEAISLLEG